MNYSQLFSECRNEIEIEIRQRAKRRIKEIMKPLYYFKEIGEKNRVEALAQELEALANKPIEGYIDRE